MKAIKVLIIDDSISQRMFLRATLEGQSNFNVIGEAVDGSDGIEKFIALKPDVTILDLVMPKTDGKEALKGIMEIDKDARVIIASSLGGENDLEECLRMGAKSFIQKPYDAEDLIQAININAAQ